MQHESTAETCTASHAKVFLHPSSSSEMFPMLFSCPQTPEETRRIRAVRARRWMVRAAEVSNSIVLFSSAEPLYFSQIFVESGIDKRYPEPAVMYFRRSFRGPRHSADARVVVADPETPFLCPKSTLNSHTSRPCFSRCRFSARQGTLPISERHIYRLAQI